MVLNLGLAGPITFEFPILNPQLFFGAFPAKKQFPTFPPTLCSVMADNTPTRRSVRKRSKKKYRYRRPRGTRAAARRAALEVLNSRISGLAGLELKYFDTSVASAVTYASSNYAVPGHCIDQDINPGTSVCPNSVSVGDGANQREGRQISMESLYVAGTVISVSYTTAAQPFNGGAGSLFVVLDTMSNASVDPPLANQIWENPSGDFTACSAPLRNMSNIKRFRVLKRIDFTSADFVTPAITATEVTSAATPVVAVNGAYARFDFFLKLKGMKTNFVTGGTAGTLDNIADNAIHLYYLRADSTATDEDAVGFRISYNARLRFRG